MNLPHLLMWTAMGLLVWFTGALALGIWLGKAIAHAEAVAHAEDLAGTYCDE